jgi:hypothetical protein
LRARDQRLGYWTIVNQAVFGQFEVTGCSCLANDHVSERWLLLLLLRWTSMCALYYSEESQHLALLCVRLAKSYTITSQAHSTATAIVAVWILRTKETFDLPLNCVTFFVGQIFNRHALYTFIPATIVAPGKRKEDPEEASCKSMPALR